MLAALAKWGIPYKAYKSDWRTHNRGTRGDGWGPINGFLVHNFGSDPSDATSLAYLYNGDLARGMPGPLSQFAIDDTGIVWLIGWGRANHGGVGDPAFLDAMIYDRLPMTADYKPATYGSVDMNAHTYGVEMLYGSAPTDAQRKTVVRLCAALMDAHGYGATSVGGHRESTTSRSDPVGFSMGPLRTEIAALLKAGPSGTQPTTTEELIVATEEDARVLLTGSAIMKNVLAPNPDSAPRVAASFLLEGGATLAKNAKASADAAKSSADAARADIAALRQELDAKLATLTTGGLDQATLEAALRNVLGSLDGK